MNPPGIIGERIAALLDQHDAVGLRDALVALLERSDSAARLRALDDAGLLTRIIPELEPARHTDQPRVHFLPVLAHSLETVAVVDWLFSQLSVVSSPSSAASHAEAAGTTDYGLPTTDSQDALPIAVRTYPELRYRSVYAAELRAHFAEQLGEGRSRATLFRLGALLHDVAKPACTAVEPDGRAESGQAQGTAESVRAGGDSEPCVPH